LACDVVRPLPRTCVAVIVP